jgi:uncharacterized protein YuzE
MAKRANEEKVVKPLVRLCKTRLVVESWMSNEKVQYDFEHDVLYIFSGEPRAGYDDEVFPGIFLRKDETDEVIGVTIMGYRRLLGDLEDSEDPLSLSSSLEFVKTGTAKLRYRGELELPPLELD